MTTIRHLLTRHRWLAAWLCVAVLALRVAVPGGYMLSAEHGRLAITVCPEFVAAPGTAMPDHAHGTPKEHGRAEQPCAFASLAAQVLATADVALPTVALAAVAALALPPVARLLPSPPHLRPPSRGPPSHP